MIYLFLFFLSIMASGVEAVTYFGFIVKHFHFSPYYIYLASIAAALLPRRVPKFISLLYPYTIILLTLMYFIFIFLEVTHYPNYIYTHFHVNPLSFQLFISIAWIHYLIQKNLSLSKILIIATLIYIGVDGAGRTIALLRNELLLIMREPFLTYDQKMNREYWGFVPAIKEVVRLTPENATILIPPQGNPWEVEGNGAMVRYFIYPRKLMNLLPDMTDLPKVEGPTYVLIAKGSWPNVANPAGYGWPKIKLDSNQIWHIDLATGKNYSYNRSYDPSTDKWDWGLIEVSND